MIRWLLRLVFIAMLGFGLLLSVVYPWAARDGSREEIGRIAVFEPETGYREVRIALDPSLAPVIVVLEITTAGAAGTGSSGVLLDVTATRADRTELFRVVSLSDAQTTLLSPQSEEWLHRLEAGTVYPSGTEPYVFSFVPGGGSAGQVSAVDLVLLGGGIDYDPTVPPIGWGIVAFGVIGMMATFRRRQRNPNDQPPPRWGRG